ncbi:MAG: ABC transporter substrate-binding protein, partial [Anaerolineales bacterium]
MKYTPGTADLVPGAAADFPTVSEDGKSYTFTIREGLEFADGTPVTAQTYVDSWDRLNTLEGQVSGLIQAYVESVEATGDLTVVYHLKDSYGFFPALSATAPFIPANPNDYPADEIDQFPEKIDGLGPYTMVSYVPGEQMELAANPNYALDDTAIIPNVIIRYYADPTTLSNAVESGEVDIAWRTVGPVEATRLMDVEGLTVTKIDAPALRYLAFNHEFMVDGQ